MPDNRLDPNAYAGMQSSYINEFNSPSGAASRASLDAKAMAEKGAYVATSAVQGITRSLGTAASAAYSGVNYISRDLMGLRNTMSPSASSIPAQFTPVGTNRYQPGFFESMRASMGLYLQAPRGMTQSEYERMARIRLNESLGSAAFEVPATIAEFGLYDIPFHSALAGFATGGIAGAALGLGVGAAVAAPFISGINKARGTLKSRRQVRNTLRTESWRFARGTGLNERVVQGLSRDLVDIASDFSGVSSSDIGNLVARASSLGMLDMAKTPEEVTRKFKSVVKKVDEMVTQMDISADEALRRIGSGNKTLTQPWLYRGMGRAAGLTTEELSRAGQESAAMFRGTGISGSWAFDLGAQTLANARNLQLSGSTGKGLVSGLGGLAATQQKMMQAQSQFMRTPQMALMIGAFANNQGALDPNQLMQFMQGGQGTEGLMQAFQSNLSANQGDIAWQSKLNMRMQENINKINPQQFNILMTKSLINDARSMVGDRAWRDLDKEGRIAIATQAVAPGAYGIDPRTARAAIESLDPEAYERQFMQQIREVQRQGIMMRERGRGLTGYGRKAWRYVTGGISEGIVSTWDSVGSLIDGTGRFLRKSARGLEMVSAQDGAFGSYGSAMYVPINWMANFFESGQSTRRVVDNLNIVYSSADNNVYKNMLKDETMKGRVDNLMRGLESEHTKMNEKELRTLIERDRLRPLKEKKRLQLMGVKTYWLDETVGYEVKGYAGEFKSIGKAVNFVIDKYREEKALSPDWIETREQRETWKQARKTKNWEEAGRFLNDNVRKKAASVIDKYQVMRWDKIKGKITISELADRAADGSEEASRFMVDRINDMRDRLESEYDQNLTMPEFLSVYRSELDSKTRANFDSIMAPTSVRTGSQSKKVENLLVKSLENINIKRGGKLPGGKDSVSQEDINSIIKSGGLIYKWLDALNRDDAKKANKYRGMLEKSGFDQPMLDALRSGYGGDNRKLQVFGARSAGLWNYRMNVAWNQNLGDLSFKGIEGLRKWFEKGNQGDFGARVADFAERLQSVVGDREATQALINESSMSKQYLAAIAKAGQYVDLDVTKTARQIMGGLSAVTPGAIVDMSGVGDKEKKAYIDLLESTSGAVDSFGTTMKALTTTLEKIGK